MPVGAIATGSDTVFAEQGGGNGNLRDVDQHALAQADGVEVGAVGAQRQLVVGAALGIVVERARQAPPRDLAQILDIGDDGSRADDAHVSRRS